MLFRTTPRPHQLASFERWKEILAAAHFWQMGVGKSWMGINQAAYLYYRGEIDAMLIVAPPTVHENWITDELPKHMPCDVPWSGHIYYSSKARNRSSQRELKAMFSEEFPILTMTYPAVRTKRSYKDKRGALIGKDLLKKFLTERKVLFCLDESQRIKTPGTQVTKALTALSRRAVHKRLFSGTSVTNSPFDVYTQIRFLDPTFWPRKGFGSYQSFKTTFGVFKEVNISSADGRPHSFQKLIYFRNLDYLCELLKEISDRHTTDEVLDLPERTFSRRYFDPSSEQKRMYKEMKRDFFTFIDSYTCDHKKVKLLRQKLYLAEESIDLRLIEALEKELDKACQKEMITSSLAMTRLIRFQQILSGFVERDAMEGGGKIPLSHNPRLSCLEDILENDVQTGEKVIVWARFRYDIDQIMKLLGNRAVRFDGAVKETDRLAARRRFQQDPECVYFVANPAAGGTGITLNEAKTVVYYTNSFNLEDRLQSQARNYRIGQTGTVNVIDILARGCHIDGHLLSRLAAKYTMQAKVMGDTLKEWI